MTGQILQWPKVWSVWPLWDLNMQSHTEDKHLFTFSCSLGQPLGVAAFEYVPVGIVCWCCCSSLLQLPKFASIPNYACHNLLRYSWDVFYLCILDFFHRSWPWFFGFYCLFGFVWHCFLVLITHEPNLCIFPCTLLLYSVYFPLPIKEILFFSPSQLHSLYY